MNDDEELRLLNTVHLNSSLMIPHCIMLPLNNENEIPGGNTTTIKPCIQVKLLRSHLYISALMHLRRLE